MGRGVLLVLGDLLADLGRRETLRLPPGWRTRAVGRTSGRRTRARFFDGSAGVAALDDRRPRRRSSPLDERSTAERAAPHPKRAKLHVRTPLPDARPAWSDGASELYDRKERRSVPLARLLGIPCSPQRSALHTGPLPVDQSLHSALGAETTNGDGFGLGWYGDRPTTPGVFHSIEPAWNDRNLHELAAHISSSHFFAHIRAAIGSPRSSRPTATRSATGAGCSCTTATSTQFGADQARPGAHGRSVALRRRSTAQPTPRCCSSSR